MTATVGFVPEPTKKDYTDPSLYRHPVAPCDLVMKGGISSGVVYPLAACELAIQHRFVALGGASAGAIAAAAVAAAEHGRESGGFARLAALPTELGGMLRYLFQPSSATRHAYELLTTWINPVPTNGRAVRDSRAYGVGRRAVRSAVTVVEHALAWFVLALVLLLGLPLFTIALTSGLGAVTWVGWVVLGLLWLPSAVAIALALATWRFAMNTSRALCANGFGLCDGHTQSETGHPPLTDWIQKTLDDLATIPTGRGRPLTFGDLWGEEAVKAQRAISNREVQGERVDASIRLQARRSRKVDLAVMTTNLTFQRPYRLPFADDNFLFCSSCLAPYFDKNVMKELTDGEKPAPSLPMNCPTHTDVRLQHLPYPWNWPVVVAVRMSLSFPGLVSAVPLVAQTSTADGDDYFPPAIMWFSDGGMSSNFPMHVFDTPLPERPTFGINLASVQGGEGQIFPPPQDPCAPIHLKATPIGSVAGFVKSILDTMQNWVDNTQIGIPGYRDRIVTIGQAKGQGGMNLMMDKTTIETLANLGADGAQVFADFDLDRHRWTRYRVAMPCIDEVMTTISTSYRDGKYADWLQEYAPTAAWFAIGAPDAVKSELAATNEFVTLAGQWAERQHPATAGDTPVPRPNLRIMPRQ